MGTTLANLHILGGDAKQIGGLMPGAAVGSWSAGCVSVFAPDLAPGLVDKRARALSGAVPQPILSVWLFDSDAVGFSIFQGGKRIASHIHNPDGYGALGNIPLFCRTWGLPEEDVLRLRAVWKKGGAEAQLELTACLLGLPLACDSETLPERAFVRETEPVDRWIRERPVPPWIKNQAKATLIQEIPRFRFHPISASAIPYYAHVEPYEEPYTGDRYHLWSAQADGTIRKIWSAEGQVRLFASASRAIGVDAKSGDVLFDTAGQLYECSLPGYLELLEDGTILQRTDSAEQKAWLACLSPEGERMWQISYDSACCQGLAQNGTELLMGKHTKGGMVLAGLDLRTGQERGQYSGLTGSALCQAAWGNSAWWIAYDRYVPLEGTENRRVDYRLVKLDRDLNVLAETALPAYPQTIFFSPGGRYGYVFFFEDQVLILNGTDLSIQNTLRERMFCMPLGFDGAAAEPRFWLLRGNSTVEAWDGELKKPVSRHRLKGACVGWHRDGAGQLCVSTWDEKKNLFRVFRLTGA